MTSTGQLFYKRRDGTLVEINRGPRGHQGKTGERGERGEQGPPVAEGGITQVDADARYMRPTGAAMVGPLTVQEPNADEEAASKLYVDTVFGESPPVNMPTTYAELVAAAGNPTDDPDQVTATHALPYPSADNGLRVQVALQMLAEALDLVIPVIMYGTGDPPEPASDYPEGSIYLRIEP